MTQGYTKGVPIDTDGTLSANSNQLVPSQAAVVTYVGAQIASGTTALTTGAASSTDNALVRFDGATGKLIKNGVITEDDTGNLSISAAVAGANLSCTVANTSNTASAQAFYQAQVAGSTAADAFIKFDISGGQNWTMGLDNSDLDVFALSSNATLGTTNVMRVQTTGEINYPLQSSVTAYVSTATIANVTGDGTLYTIIYDSEYYDQNSDFNTATGTFTAPVTGKYLVSGLTTLTGLGTSTGFYTIIATSTREYWGTTLPLAAAGANVWITLPYSFVADMTAADTLVSKVAGGASTKTVDIMGVQTRVGTYLSISLLC